RSLVGCLVGSAVRTRRLQDRHTFARDWSAPRTRRGGVMISFRTANLRLEATGPEAVTLWLDVTDRPVNVFNRQVIADLDQAFSAIAADASLKVLVVHSAKPSGFIAGADLHEFTAVQSLQDAVALSERGQRLFDRVARLPQTTIAVIHGPCLGGGLEFA